MRKLLLAAALAGTAIGAAALAGQDGAADRGRGGGGMMMRADTNNDGAISRAEFTAQTDQRFVALDKNGDGKLSGDELTGARGMGGRGPGGGLIAADADHDGSVSHAEYSAQAGDRFAKLDTNSDGQISADEMKAMMDRMRAGRGGFNGGGGGGGMMVLPSGTQDSPTGHGGRMARLDTDHDGRISHDEMQARADERFAKLDANHDGFIDKAEMTAAHDRMRQHFGRMRGHWRHGPGAPGDNASPPGADAPGSDPGQ